MRTNLRRAGVMLAALLMAACAGNRAEPGEAGGDEVVRVVITNDGTIPTQVRVYLVQEGGVDIMLGSMSTLGTETLTGRAPVIGGTYQLRAVGGTDHVLVSPRVQLRGNETISWDMRRNVVRINQ